MSSASKHLAQGHECHNRTRTHNSLMRKKTNTVSLWFCILTSIHEMISLSSILLTAASSWNSSIKLSIRFIKLWTILVSLLGDSSCWKKVETRRWVRNHHIEIIISKSCARIYQKRYSKKVYTNFQKDKLLRPNYLAPYKGLQGATAHTAAIAKNTGVNPFYFW